MWRLTVEKDWRITNDVSLIASLYGRIAEYELLYITRKQMDLSKMKTRT